MKNDIITLEITDVTPEGFGVGRVDGKVYFVADTAIGDICDCLVMKELKSHSFAKLVNIKTPSADRIDPNCAVCKRCGGCAFRHISYAGMACIATYKGLGFQGYKEALKHLTHTL